MNRPFLHRRPWLPVVWLFNASWTTFLFLAHAMLHATCRVRIVGTEYLQGRGNYVFTAWHEHAVPYCVAYRKSPWPMFLIGNDAWYMTPIRVFMLGKGVEKWLSMNRDDPVGESVALLRGGLSTVIYPDGPVGPRRVLKRGLMAMAMLSGVPVAPWRTETSAAWIWRKSWDGKRVPLPFSTVTLTFYPPIVVTEANAAEAQKQILAALG